MQATKNIVDNNVRTEKCPGCHSLKIKREFPAFDYYKPIMFSTTEVELKRQPEIWICEECQSKFVQNIVSEDAAIKLYSSGDSQKRWASAKTFTEEKTADLVEILATYFTPESKILDIGCSTGYLLDFAKSKGSITHGVEYSLNALQIAAANGHTVYSGIEKVQEKFDVITAFDVVEHLYDLPSFFMKVKDLLNKNGYLIILTGNPDCSTATLTKTKWWYFNFPEHIVFPSPFFFKNKVENFKLDLYHRTYNSKAYVPKHWLGFIRMVIYFLIRYKKYIGIPTTKPDHGLIVLQKLD